MANVDELKSLGERFPNKNGDRIISHAKNLVIT